MKKIIKLSMVAALLTTGLMAADTTSLTRATVKLIQNQNEIESSLNNLDSKLKTMENLSSEQKTEIKVNKEDLVLLKERVDNSDKNIDELNSKYKLLSGDIKQVRAESEKAVAVSQHTAKVLEELSKVSEVVKEKSNLVQNATNGISLSNQELKDRVEKFNIDLKNLEKNINENSETLIKNIALSEKNQSGLRELALQMAKQESQMNEKINSLKVVYDAELNILKAKLEKARPILVSDTNISANSTNCINVSAEEEALIQDFLGK